MFLIYNNKLLNKMEPKSYRMAQLKELYSNQTIRSYFLTYKTE